jgi:hypothetical protein
LFAVPSYFYLLKDAPGVVAANTFLSVFNPASNGKLNIPFELIVSNYSTNASQTADSMTVSLISSASGGTPVAANTINRFVPSWPDPVADVRIGNPTVVTTGLPLVAFPPPYNAAGAQGSAAGLSQLLSGQSFILNPGVGVAFQTAAGNTAQVWNINFFWAEAP